MATAIKREIAQDTNSIVDDMTRRAVQKVANQLNEGMYDQKIQGTSFSVTAAEMDQRALTVKLEDVSVAQSVYAVIPYTGNISTIYAVMGATTVGPTPEVFSFGVEGINLSGNVMTISTGTVATTGTSSLTPTASAKAVSAGDILRISSNGGSTGPTMDAMFTILVDIT